MIRQTFLHKSHTSRCMLIADGKKTECPVIMQNIARVQTLFFNFKTSKPVGIFLPNNADFVAAFYGIIQSDMIALPIHIQLKKQELLELIQMSELNAVITCTQFRSFFQAIKSVCERELEIFYMDELPHSLAPHFECEAKTNLDDPMVLLSTSGTVGKSKIVQLSERNILTSTLGYLNKLHFQKDELPNIRYFLATPLASSYGIMIMTACFIMDFPLVVTADNFTLESFFRAVEEYKITHYEGGCIAVQLMEKMLGKPIKHDISSLKFFGFGGSRISAQTIENLQKNYPETAFLQGYGMTETAPLITKLERYKAVRPHSVGTAIDGIAIAIKTQNEICSVPYTYGEIVVKGDNVMLGYYKNPSETSKIISESYLHTGDIGHLDEDGYLYLCGRKKNIVIVRGFNVHPEEVEDCILNSGLVTECLVYGINDNTDIETLCADIVLANSSVNLTDIKSYCSARLANYKQPKIYRICLEIQKNLSGKATRQSVNPSMKYEPY